MRLSEYDKKRNYIGDFRITNVPVRIYGTRFEPWFVIEDVRKAAGIPPELDLPVRRKRVINVEDGSQLWLTDELGLYMLLIKTDTQLSNTFAGHLAESVLPHLRRYGCSRSSRYSRSR